MIVERLHQKSPSYGDYHCHTGAAFIIALMTAYNLMNITMISSENLKAGCVGTLPYCVEA